MSKPPPGYLHTDEREELVNALRKVRTELEAARTDDHAWKWVIHALQSAVQNAIVAAISGTDGLGALTDRSARERMEDYENDTGRHADAWLADFRELYRRMKSRTAFPPSPDVDEDLGRLVRLRNQFEHFAPKGWSIQLAGLPRIVRNLLRVVEHLGWSPGHILWYEEALREEARRQIDSILVLLDDLDRRYADER
jgi:hypothetical protein